MRDGGRTGERTVIFTRTKTLLDILVVHMCMYVLVLLYKG